MGPTVATMVRLVLPASPAVPGTADLMTNMVAATAAPIPSAVNAYRVARRAVPRSPTQAGNVPCVPGAHAPVVMLLPQLDGCLSNRPDRPHRCREASTSLQVTLEERAGVEVKIGVSDSPRELVFNSSDSPEVVEHEIGRRWPTARC